MTYQLDEKGQSGKASQEGGIDTGSAGSTSGDGGGRGGSGTTMISAADLDGANSAESGGTANTGHRHGDIGVLAHGRTRGQGIG